MNNIIGGPPMDTLPLKMPLPMPIGIIESFSRFMLFLKPSSKSVPKTVINIPMNSFKMLSFSAISSLVPIGTPITPLIINTQIFFRSKAFLADQKTKIFRTTEYITKIGIAVFGEIKSVISGIARIEKPKPVKPCNIADTKKISEPKI